jgi:hypothetical protein
LSHALQWPAAALRALGPQAPPIWTVVLACMVANAMASDVRERTRPKHVDGASVSAAQAQDLTLTVSPVTRRAVQGVLRTAGTADVGERSITAQVCTSDAQFLKLGQRARIFSVSARSSMYQARITHLGRSGDCTVLQVDLAGRIGHAARHYLMEVVIDHGERLCVPNEAIIEEEQRRVVYVQRNAETFEARDITVGLQGEAYSEVLEGVRAGEQVVTIGSFFVDSEFKMQRGN